MSTNEQALRALNLLFGENSIEMSDNNARLYDEIVNALSAEQPQSDVQRDAERLDWLEGEMEREREAIRYHRPPPDSMFRRNMPITRAAIDEAMKERT